MADSSGPSSSSVMEDIDHEMEIVMEGSQRIKDLVPRIEFAYQTQKAFKTNIDNLRKAASHDPNLQADVDKLVESHKDLISDTREAIATIKECVKEMAQSLTYVETLTSMRLWDMSNLTGEIVRLEAMVPMVMEDNSQGSF